MVGILVMTISSFKLSSKRIVFFVLSMLFVSTMGNAQNNSKTTIVEEIRAFEQKKDFTPKDTMYINLLNSLSYKLTDSKSDSLVVIAKKALKLSQDIDFAKGEMHSQINLANYYRGQLDFENALKSYTTALNSATNLNAYKLIPELRNSIATIYKDKGDLGNALKNYVQSMTIGKKYNQHKIVADSYIQMSNLYSSINDTKEAISYLLEGYDWAVDSKNDKLKADIASKLAYLYVDYKDYDKAQSYVDESIQFFENKEMWKNTAFNYTVKGMIFVEQNNTDEGLLWLNKALKQYNTIANSTGTTELYRYLGKAYFLNENYAIAEEYAKKGLELAEKSEQMWQVQLSARTLALIYLAKNDSRSSLKYNEIYQKLRDSILFNDKIKKLALLKSKVEYDNENKQLIEENNRALARQKRITYGAVGASLIGLLFVFIVRRNAKIKKRLSNSLKMKKEELEKREVVLKEANRTKDKLFSIIGHDLRSPIGAFQGLLGLFREKEIDKEEFISFVPKMESDLSHISFLLNNLLSWGRSQMNGSITKPELVDIEPLVEENIHLLSEVADNKLIVLKNEVTKGAKIWADVNQIDIVFRNLISNALKFTPVKGTVTIGTIENETTWTIFVRDTGIGMTKEVQQKIFSENSNHTTYGTNNEKGTGLGLNLCKEMVLKNKGEIWVESTPNVGSCFYFEIDKNETVSKDSETEQLNQSN